MKDQIIVKKADFKKLYDMACKNWKPKLDDKLKTFLFSEYIEFENSFIEEMQKACTKEQLVVFKKIFKEYKLVNLFDTTTYSQVCKELGEKEFTIKDFKDFPKYLQENQLAYIQIKQVEKYFNGTWIINWLDSNQYKYYPYFKNTSSGLVLYGCHCYDWFSHGLVAYYRDEETAKHVGTHFKHIYQKLQ